MNGDQLLLHATTITMGLLLLAMVLVIVRLIRGPTLADRILALDMLTTVAIAVIATFAVRTGFTLYLDIAISLGLLGFLSTVAFSRYLLKRASTDNQSVEEGET